MKADQAKSLASSETERRSVKDPIWDADDRSPWDEDKASNDEAQPSAIPAIVLPRGSDSALASTAPERLRLERWEQDAIKLCHPLFRTPRAVKRLANTYCLIRTGVSTQDWRSFIGNADRPHAEYRTPLLMLAVSAAYPGLAALWFEKLKTGTDWLAGAGGKASPSSDEKPDAAGKDEWRSLESALRAMDADSFAPFDKEKVSAWLPRVKRYSF